MVDVKKWFDSEQGILTHYREERDAEAARHAEAMVRIGEAERQHIEAFRQIRGK
jgi:hypothetical protein